MRPLTAASLLALACFAVARPAWAQHPAAPSPPALEPASSGGVEAVDRALAKLSMHARMLVVGAHPDDEDNALLTWVSRGLGGEVAYLSLSRGEGGQNLIGPELGVGLGLIRTGELLAARRIEGTRQLFARAYDFGYTRSLDETFERWPRAVLREDGVRAARRFKPQVIVAIFPEDERARHGQHQASAVVARDVYESAGDPAAFTGLGLPPWRPRALYRRAWSRDDATLRFPLGEIDPLSGRSLAQIAAASRSLHRSQDMGRVQRPGGFEGGLVWLAGGAGAAAEGPFAGIDTRLAAIAASLETGAERSAVVARLEAVESLARELRAELRPRRLSAAVPGLSRILVELRAALDLLPPGPGTAAVADLLEEKIAVAETGLAAAAGVVFDAVADRETAVLGGSLAVTASLWPAGEIEPRVESVELVPGAGWRPGQGTAVDDEKTAPGVRSWRFEVEVPETAGPTVPYFLRGERQGDLYDWSAAPESVRGEPYGPPPLTARFELTIAGVPVVLEREVVHRYAEQAEGEVRRPLRAVPALEVSVEPELLLLPLEPPDGAGDRELEVVIVSHSESPVEGEVILVPVADAGPMAQNPNPPPAPPAQEGGRRAGVLPDGASSMLLSVAGGGRSVWRPRLGTDGVAAGRYHLAAAFRPAGGDAYGKAYPLLDPPHVRPAARPQPAVVEIEVLDLRLPALERVGYVRGASDRVPELLAEVGVPLELLGPEALRHGDLERFDAIVVGSRAYETDAVLRDANGRLLDYARAGGTLIVQYQQYQYVSGGFAPLALDIARPHGRVTDETAPVRVLEPRHPVLDTPNRIGEADWSGWVQERGLYFASSWDDAFTPILGLRDRGRDEELGALLVAGVGRGTYVYTGLSFFRQLPAGVPGAFRLFANLLSLADRGGDGPGETR